MAKLFFEASGCQGATSGASGRRYDADRQGFIHVTDSADIKTLKSGGYIEAGAVARASKYWTCDDCSWDANINHCSRCGSDNLRRIEA